MIAPVADNPPQLLLAAGLEGPHIDAYRERVRAEVRRVLIPEAATAEATCRFPRTAIEQLGAAGLFRERWSGGPEGDLGRAVILAEELGNMGAGGPPPGVTIHGEAVLSMLYRFGRTPFLREYTELALAGKAIGCVGTSEDGGGSDISHTTRTLAVPDGDGWRISGEKSYVSLGGAADFALVGCRLEGKSGQHGRERLAVFLVPEDGFEVVKRHLPAGSRGLETVRLAIDASVPGDAILGRPGTGMLALSWGLTHERLAASAVAMGTCSLAITLATTHLRRRHVSGTPLMERQALRLRLAELASKVSVLRLAIRAIAATGTLSGARRAREVAGIKVNAARLSERVMSECMHLFGGLGYLEDDAPLARMWRDIRLTRLGGGTDEVMWEMVASGLAPDEEEYDRLVTGGEAAAPDAGPKVAQPRAVASSAMPGDGLANMEGTVRR